MISNSFNEVVLIGTSVIFNLPLAILPIQILWIKMIEDSFPSIALAFDPINDNVMSLPPRNPKEDILNKNFKKLLIFFILLSDSLLLFIFYYFFMNNGEKYAQTAVFVGMGIASRFYVFSIRNLHKSIFTYSIFKNKFVNISTIFGFFMILIAVYFPFFNVILHTVPLQIKDLAILICYGFATLIIYEIGKKIFIYKN